MHTFFSFIENQILKMNWLNDFINLILNNFNLNKRLQNTISFFFYDLIKITLLLCILIFAISYIQSYFPPERSKKILSKFKGVSASIIAALLGTVTPFCACSSIPLFIGFSSAKIPIHVSFAFLISSPMVDLGSLVLLISIFGFKVALAYVILGLLIAVVGSLIISKLKMEDQMEYFIFQNEYKDSDLIALNRKDRLIFAKDQMLDTLKKVFLYIVIGVLIGSIIHNWVPKNLIEKLLGESNHLSVILATLIGAPIYADIFSVIPIAQALFSKGVLLGTILSFMMATTTLSIPSLIMLRQAIKPKLLATFIIICIIGIVITGYLFNIIAYYLI